MRIIPTYKQFLEKKEKEDFEDKIKDHGYYKGISTSTARKKEDQMKKQASMDDDNPDAYKELPGDTKGKKLLKKSKHTSDYEDLYADESLEEKKPAGAPDWHDSDAPDANGRFRDLSPKDLASWLIKTRKKDLKKISGSLTQQVVFNRKEDPEYAEKMEKTRQEVYKQLGRKDLMESATLDDMTLVYEKAEGDRSKIGGKGIEAGLKKKADETGVPIGILRIIMRRGMAAWKSGHRPGAGQEQWGYARVNSFLTQAPGTWGRPKKNPKKNGPKGQFGADADVAKEVIDGGHDKKLKSK